MAEAIVSDKVRSVRNGLAAVCFVLCAASLLLWAVSEVDQGDYWTLPMADEKVTIEAVRGMVIIGKVPQNSHRSGALFYSFNVGDEARVERLGFPYESSQKMGVFGIVSPYCYFPLWYPVLLFGVAGFGATKFDGRFTLRTAMIAVAVVVVLMGVAAAL